MKRKQHAESSEVSASKGRRCIWTEEEDRILLKMAKKGKNVDWNRIAECLEPLGSPPKSAKQCRERWHNRVNPSIKQSSWTAEEIDLFFDLYKEHGPKWSRIALELPGRTDNTIKNLFYCRLRKMARRIKKGIISEDMKNSPKEVEHTLFLIHYLRAYYLSGKDASHPVSDKYISDMIQSASISLEKIDSYLKSYQAAVKNTSQVSETDDSLSKLHPLQSDVLPLTVGDTGNNLPGKLPPLIPQLDALFLGQLGMLQAVNAVHITLPLPNTFLPKKPCLEDTFQPTFIFGDRLELTVPSKFV